MAAQIGESVGLPVLETEVAALGHRLEEVRESLTTLAEAAQAKVQQQAACVEELRDANAFLLNLQKVSPPDYQSLVLIDYTCNADLTRFEILHYA